MDATTAEQMSAWGAAVGGGATLVAATAGVFAAVAAVRALRAAKRDSRDRSRPMVGALLTRDDHPTSVTADLVVRSYGQSVAYNVEVSFSPALVDVGTTSGQRTFVPTLLSRYSKPIPNLMPGVELRNLWFAPGESKDGVVQNDEPIPDVVEATIKYRDRPASDAKGNHYVDTFVLDIPVLRGDVRKTYTDDHLGLHKRSTKALESYAPALSRVARDIHRIEEYVKPDGVREREAADAESSAREVESLQRQLMGEAQPDDHR